MVLEVSLSKSVEEIYLAGGCLWGVQEFIKHVPGVLDTQAGRANGNPLDTQNDYDGYAECVRVRFNPSETNVSTLMEHLFEIIDPYSVNQQGQDVGEKYRTGVYSLQPKHLVEAQRFILARPDSDKIALEIMQLTNYVASDDIHQNHLSLYPEDHHLCHIPWSLLHKYKVTP